MLILTVDVGNTIFGHDAIMAPAMHSIPTMARLGRRSHSMVVAILLAVLMAIGPEEAFRRRFLPDSDRILDAMLQDQGFLQTHKPMSHLI